MSMHDRMPLSRVCFVLLAALCACMGGCYTEGGSGYVDDTHTYVSRPWQPWTITVRDTRTGQEFWSMDVPVGKKLVVVFARGGGTSDKYTPDTMKWGMTDEYEDMGIQMTNSLPCPPADSRRLEPTLRTAPELPESMVTATKGTMPAARVQTVRPPSVAIPVQPKNEPEEPPPPPPPAPGAKSPQSGTP